MKKRYDKHKTAAKNSDISDIILHSKPVIITFIVAVLGCIVLLAIRIFAIAEEKQFQKMLAEEENVSVSEPEIRLTAEDLKTGKYYLNGDTDSYYFQINENNTIELVCDDLYAIFEPWNPENEEATEKFVKEYSSPQSFEAREVATGEVLVETKLIYDEDYGTYIGGTGPMLVDYGTLRWGIEGDFIYAED